MAIAGRTRRFWQEYKYQEPVKAFEGTHTMRTYSALYWIALILTVIGGLNWGLVGLIDLNVVEAAFGAATIVTRAIYVVVGLAALYLIAAALMERPVDTARPVI